MKYIEEYNKIFEKNEDEERLFDYIIKWDDGDYLEDFVHRYRKYGAFFNDDYDANNFWLLKYLAFDAGKNSKVFFFNNTMEHYDLISYLEILSNKKIKDLWDKRVIEGTYDPDNNILTVRGFINNNVLDIIVNKLFSINKIKSSKSKSKLIISVGASSLRSYDTVIEIPYKDYNKSITDTSLSMLYKIMDLFKDREEFLKDFDIISAVNPLPNDIQSKVIDKFNRMFIKSPNMKIKIMPKGMSTAEYKNLKTKYKFTESKDIKL